MKTIKLTILALIISTFCYSQSYNKISKCVFIKYVGTEWVDKDVNYPERIFVILNDSEVNITNEAKTKIITYGNPEKKNYDDGQVTMWDAYDEDGKNCVFMIKYFYGTKTVVFTLAYLKQGYGFQYYSTY
jgi:hypothetical protein